MENQKKVVAKLTYNVDLPTLNEYIEIERANKYRASTSKRVWTQKIKWYTMEQGIHKIPKGLYDIEVVWYRQNKKHDADNVFFGIKFILDGIVASGIIPGDDRKVIRDISHKIRQGEKNYVEVYFLNFDNK